MQTVVLNKRCSTCKQAKACDSFYKNRCARDGFAHECKECARNRVRSAYYKTDERRATDRARYQSRVGTPEGKARLYESNRKYKQSEKGKLAAWARYLLKNYAMSLEAYDRLLESQGGRCAVCRVKPQPGRRLHIDHDHVTYRVRGILCGKCNQAIGLLNENPVLFDRAKSYLQSR